MIKCISVKISSVICKQNRLALKLYNYKTNDKNRYQLKTCFAGAPKADLVMGTDTPQESSNTAKKWCKHGAEKR